MEETEKRSKTKSRKEMFKEFVIPKIIEKLEAMRAEDVEYQQVVKNEFSYSEQKVLLKRLAKSDDFKQSVVGWKNEFDKQHPSETKRKENERKRKLKTSRGLNDDVPEIDFF